MCLLLSLSLLPAAAQTAMLSDLTGKLDKLVPELLSSEQIPGAAIAIIHQGNVIWAQGYGAADLKTQQPVTADSIFSVASISKAVTAWEVMRLVEAGKLDLDAPIEQYLQSWKLPKSAYDSKQVTVRRVLSHTAGLSIDGYPGFEPGDRLPTLEDFLSTPNRAVAIAAEPGKRFSYSGGGYTVMQLALQDISGQPFAELMQTAVLNPLKLSHSSFIWSPELKAVTAYDRAGEPFTKVVHLDQAAGGLYASVNDLATFFTSVMPGHDWLKPESIGEMFGPAPKTGDRYGFGYFNVKLKGNRRAYWHDGIGVGARSLFMLLPDTGDGVVILTNSGNGHHIMKAILCAWGEWAAPDAKALCGYFAS
jgi:CubicO group peptidase (beta-lactamase class C family)